MIKERNFSAILCSRIIDDYFILNVLADIVNAYCTYYVTGKSNLFIFTFNNHSLPFPLILNDERRSGVEINMNLEIKINIC